jgi:hypothetical protein
MAKPALPRTPLRAPGPSSGAQPRPDHSPTLDTAVPRWLSDVCLPARMTNHSSMSTSTIQPVGRGRVVKRAPSPCGGQDGRGRRLFTHESWTAAHVRDQASTHLRIRQRAVSRSRVQNDYPVVPSPLDQDPSRGRRDTDVVTETSPGDTPPLAACRGPIPALGAGRPLCHDHGWHSRQTDLSTDHKCCPRVSRCTPDRWRGVRLTPPGDQRCTGGSVWRPGESPQCNRDKPWSWVSPAAPGTGD